MRITLRFPDGRKVPIRIGRGLLSETGKALRRCSPVLALLVTDRGVPSRLRDQVLDSLRAEGIPVRTLTFPSGESSKRLGELERLARASARAGLRRDGVVVALGGGVTGDLAAFLASVYMRGVPLLQLPTTLLAQVDAGVGGKCGLDLPEGKNLIGSFHQPVAVLCDLNALASLSERHYREGFAEIVKCALLSGPKALGGLERDAAALCRRDRAALGRAVALALGVKTRLVSRDERETKGLRERLNLGHTLGHAAEAAAGYRLSHGEAVSAGIVAALRISSALGVLRDPRLPVRVQALLARLGLPIAFPPGLDRKRMIEALGRDKKGRAGKVRMILPVSAGRLVARPVPLDVLWP